MDYDEVHNNTLNSTGYWGAKGAGCIIIAESTGRVLIPRRSSLVLEPNTWGVFGGAIDPEENEKQAVAREVDEEAGHHINPIDLVVLYTYTDEDKDFKYTTYLYVVDEEFTPTLNWENKAAHWFDCGNWPSPLHYGLKKIFTDPTASGIIERICREFKQQSS